MTRRWSSARSSWGRRSCSASAIDEAFRPGVSTRSRDTHLGVGLGLARELLSEIGGTLEITPADGGAGVVARLGVPALV